MKTKSSPQRLQYLDWVRGLGAVIMLQGHVFDSYLRPDLRPGAAFTSLNSSAGCRRQCFFSLRESPSPS